MAKHRVRFLFLVLTLALCFALVSPSSYAMGRDAFKAWMLSALTAANITVQSTLPVVAPVSDFIVDPFNIVENVMDRVEYTYPFINYNTPSEDLETYLERSSIIVRGDTITIDGIDYTDIWVDNDAAHTLRTNVLDLQTAWEIASNSSGNFVSGTGSYYGIPLFGSGDSYCSQFYSLDGYGSFKLGDITLTLSRTGSGSDRWYTWDYFNAIFNYPDGTSSSGSGRRYLTFPSGEAPASFGAAVMRTGASASLSVDSWHGDYPSGYFFSPASSSLKSFSSEPFDFSWVSQEIPAEVLPEEDGMHLLVPNNPSQWSDTGTQQIINNFNNNLTLSPDVSISMGDPGIMDILDTILTGIGDILILTKPSYGPYDASPVPPVDPDTIANTPWTQLADRLDRIIQHQIEQGTIIGSIATTISTIPQTLSDIADSIGDLTQKFEDASRKWFDDVVDSIKTPFLPWFNIFKSGVNIWHYVVAWLGNISAPFTFFFGVLNSANSALVSPILACVAGTIVIAIYRRFGR